MGEMCAVVPQTDISGYVWQHPRPQIPQSLRIYELHVGSSSEAAEVATWDHAREHVLPRVAALGYTAILLLAVHEHGYYASFGYMATSLLAPTSRFGSPAALQVISK